MDRKRKPGDSGDDKAGSPAKQARVVVDGDDDVQDTASRTRDLLSLIGAGGAGDADATGSAAVAPPPPPPPPPLQIRVPRRSSGPIILGGGTSTPLMDALGPFSPGMMERAAASASSSGTLGIPVPLPVADPGQSSGPIILGGDTSTPLMDALGPFSPGMMERAAASASASGTLGIPVPLPAAAADANAGQNVAYLYLEDQVVPDAGPDVADLQAQLSPDSGQDVASPQPQPAPDAAGADASCPACRIRPATLRPPDHPCLCEECLAADAACPVCAAGPPPGGA
ncbi:hypothetical protein ACP4OV_010884 [Aristida adscensionis]